MSVGLFPTKSVGLVNFPTKYTAQLSLVTLDMLDTKTHWGMDLYHDNRETTHYHYTNTNGT